MGAEQSALDPAYKGAGLSSSELGQLKAAEKSRSASMKQKPGSRQYMADVTAYPEKVYKADELAAISGNLSTRLNGLTADMKKKADNQLAGYISAYQGITDGRGKSVLASKIEQHKSLNRYNNILAYDDSRVKVTPNKDNGNSDYINANHVKGYKFPNKYIATQGPIPQSMNAFWQMVWEYDIPTIVMVTNEVEGGKLKCHRYWPEGEGQNTLTYGAYTVTNTSVEVLPLYQKRTFRIQHNNTGKTRDVTQYLYTAWPDHGVPATTEEMLQFRTTVRKGHPDTKKMVVHCSAGVGRTGTFIALDRYLDSCSSLDKSEDYDLHGIVRDLRSSRNFMVQAQAQYVYLHEAAKDGLAKLHTKAVREAAYIAKNEQDQAAMVTGELAADVKRKEDNVREIRRQWLVAQTTAKPVVPDLTRQIIEATPYTADIHTTSRLTGEVRRESLAASTTQWVDRAVDHRIPLSPDEHGYADPSAPPLTSRLMALSDARTAWLTRYTDAERTWALAHASEEVVYDVGQEMTPLESRVSSLAASEEAWRLKSGSELTLAEERARLETNDLTMRLESLQFTVLNTERRWRSAGHNFAPSNEGPQETGEYGTRISSTEKLGGLTDRLGLLQKEQSAWESRENVSLKRFKEGVFHEDITEVATAQEKLAARRAEVAAQQAAEEAAEAAAKAEAAKVAKATKLKADKEETRKQKRKDTHTSFAAKMNTVDESDPAEQRKRRDQKEQEDIALAAEVARMEEEEKQFEEESKASAASRKASAKKKANKFMGSMK